MKKSTLKSLILTAGGILLASFLRAISVHSFIVANDFAPGGVTGISAMIQFATDLNSGIFLFAINIPLVILAFFFVNKAFAVKSAISTALSSGLLMLFEFIDFFAYTDKSNLILAAIAAGVINAAALALILKVGGSMGGTDIVAMMIQKKHTETNVAWFIFLLDGVVVFISFFVYGNLTAVMLALVEMFVSAKGCDMIMQGLKSAQKFEIITDYPDEISKEIMERLQRGVTMIEATGMYAHAHRHLLICVVRRRQITEFRAILKKYPDTFAYLSSTTEVMGRGFSA